MFKRLRKLFKESESGQTLIFVAVLGTVLMGVVVLAVEGGRTFVEYRKMQAAADMAAIVGAQSLPCGTNDTTCITNAETQACNYAASNGFSSCTIGGASSPSANVPPKACSPYDFMDYGNGSGNASCKSTTAPTFYDYIEVRLTDSLGTIPLFNVAVTLGAHAVAKHGVGIPGDYALVSLSPTTPMSMGGSNTTILEGSVFANGGISGNGGTACGGGWFSAGSVSGVTTNSTGTITYSPPGCSGSNDTTPVTNSNLPQIQNPYGSSVAPPTTTAGFPNCTECVQSGYWLDLGSGTWSQGGAVSGSNVELFPGTYTSLSLSNGGQAYFNPGVYTFTSGIDTNHGTMCIYGAPDCLNNSCASTQWTSGSVAGDQWNYSCSQWGFWDPCTTTCSRPAGLPTTAPTWYDTSTGASSSVPLNGVTIYFPANAGGITEHGNGGKDGGQYLAAPNPCPGTGTYSAGAVSFPAGHTLTGSESFDYTGTTASSHGLPAVSARQVYPSVDLSLLGECSLAQSLVVWPGEMTKPQHLHFLFYMDPTGNDSFLTGASGQDWYGIFYAPGSSLTLRGAGKGSGGPPWITGQMIVNTLDWSGHSYADITYRPCGPGSTACGSGRGTQLVQ